MVLLMGIDEAQYSFFRDLKVGLRIVVLGNNYCCLCRPHCPFWRRGSTSRTPISVTSKINQCELFRLHCIDSWVVLLLEKLRKKLLFRKRSTFAGIARKSATILLVFHKCFEVENILISNHSSWRYCLGRKALRSQG